MRLIIFTIILMLPFIGLYLIIDLIEKKRYNNHDKPFITRIMIYISGYDTIRPGSKVFLKCFRNRIEIYDSVSKTTKIPYENLIDLELKTEAQIKSSTTLPRFLILGALAFFAQKTTEEKDHYLLLKFNLNNEEHHLLMKHMTPNSSMEDTVTKIRQAKWDYENKNNTTIGENELV